MSSIARCSNSSATGRSPVLQRLADGAVIFVRTADRLLENRRIGGDALHAVGVDQLLEVALGDEAAGQKIQPDRLAVRFECFDRIHDALCSILGFQHLFWREAGLSTRGWACRRAEYGCLNKITPFTIIRSLRIGAVDQRWRDKRRLFGCLRGRRAHGVAAIRCGGGDRRTRRGACAGDPVLIATEPGHVSRRVETIENQRVAAVPREG